MEVGKMVGHSKGEGDCGARAAAGTIQEKRLVNHLQGTLVAEAAKNGGRRGPIL